MEAAGLTVKSLAIRAGVTDPCMYRLKAGKSLPSEKTLERIAWVIDADIADLIWLRSQHPLYKEKVAGVSKNVSSREPRTIICKKCGLPGTAKSYNVKYPHEECRIEAKHERAREASRECYKAHGVSHLQNQLSNMQQNETLLKNRSQEKERECLKCEREFMSKGPWNRICSRCKRLQLSAAYGVGV